MSSTQHIILTVDNKVVYDSSPTTTPAPAAALTRPAATEIDVKNLILVSNPIQNREYYFVTIDINKKPPVQSNRKKGTFISKRERDSDTNETTYEYTVDTAEEGKVTYTNYAGPNGRGGTEVTFYEIPLAGGKRRNNKRKSARKGGRSRRMRRMRRSNNRKSSRRF